MNRPTPAQRERATRLLALERAGDDADHCASAAARVHDTIHTHLDPLVGAAGVHALLVRSVKLTRDAFPFLDAAAVEDSTKLRACLMARDPAIAAEAAAVLYGTFFTLITTFIGERLTTQILLRAWPTIEDAASRSTK